MPREHSRSRCVLCHAELVFLVGDPRVPYEEIDPLEGGPRTLVEHDASRCGFHRFFHLADPEPLPGEHGSARKIRRRERWIRTDP